MFTGYILPYGKLNCQCPRFPCGCPVVPFYRSKPSIPKIRAVKRLQAALMSLYTVRSFTNSSSAISCTDFGTLFRYSSFNYPPPALLLIVRRLFAAFSVHFQHGIHMVHDYFEPSLPLSLYFLFFRHYPTFFPSISSMMSTMSSSNSS